jgi:hypothetical protein
MALYAAKLFPAFGHCLFTDALKIDTGHGAGREHHSFSLRGNGLQSIRISDKGPDRLFIQQGDAPGCERQVDLLGLQGEVGDDYPFFLFRFHQHPIYGEGM